jgi:hypothetical protein
MHPFLVKLVAMLLLIVQGAIATAPGQVLCIPVRDCDTHEHEAGRACGHCDTESCAQIGEESGGVGQNQGTFPAALHPNDDCGCHLHVPVPGDEQVPSSPRGENPDLRMFFVPLVVLVLNWDCEPPRAVIAHFHPPDFSASDQVLALKATRLLI